MNILITGANGFVGKNLSAALNNIKENKDRTHPEITVDSIYLYDIGSSPEELDEACKNADFVFNLAGINRPKDESDFIKGNYGFASVLLDTLKKHGNTCPVISLIIKKKQAQRCSFTGSPIFSANGADLITTRQSLHFAIISQTICL